MQPTEPTLYKTLVVELLPLWCVLAGVIPTLIGVWIANVYNLRQQRQQFEHEASESARERRQQLRRDVYLAASDAIVDLWTTLGRATDLNVPEAELGAKVAGIGAPITRALMVATPETVKSVAALQSESMSLFMDLLRERVPLTFRRIDIRIAEEAAKRHEQSRDAVFERIKESNLKGITNEDVRSELTRQYNFAEEYRQLAADELTQLNNVQMQEHFELLERFAPRFAQIQALWPAALVAIREELDSPKADAAISDAIAAMTERGLQALNQTMVTLRALLEDKGDK